MQFSNDSASSNNTTGNVVEGNLIGTNAAGTAAPLGTNVNYAGVQILFGASGNTVGGTARPGVGNVIDGSQYAGVDIGDSGTSSNLVQGNFIGTDSTGTVALANSYGVIVELGASDNTIGGTCSSTRNNITGNTQTVVVIGTSGKDGNVVEGNYIGTNAAPARRRLARQRQRRR